jgi:aryl carrier-like protein
MVPAYFVALEALPLTSNGKLDRRALPEPASELDAQTYRAPTNDNEALLCRLFSELTGTTEVGLDDSFFAIGGHSLLAMRLVAKVRERSGIVLSLRSIFEHPTVQALALALSAVQHQHDSSSPSAIRAAIVPGQGARDNQRTLSYGQIRFWTLEQIEEVQGSYNIPSALKLTGDVDAQALNQALVDIIRRHEPLRTYILSEDGDPVGYVQEIASDAQLLDYEDLSEQTQIAREQTLEQLIRNDSTAPFDLSADLMLRARLVRLRAGEYVLILVMHHIAGDGVSVGVFCQELAQAYRARSNNQAPAWVPLGVSYADYSAWQREWLEGSGELERQSQSWQTQLKGQQITPEMFIAAALPVTCPLS